MGRGLPALVVRGDMSEGRSNEEGGSRFGRGRGPVAIAAVAGVLALTALGIGTVILFKPKGTGFHKTLGWTWVIAMGTTAVSSLFITGLNGNFYSFIHLLSGWTIIGLPMAIYAIRNRKVDAHKRAMTGMFVGGLLIAGALTFLPGRFMFEFLLG